MYPDFYHLLKELFGIEIPVLGLLKSFGFMVAMAFLAAGIVLTKELKRKEDLGLLPCTIEDLIIRKKVQWTDYLISGVLGFGIGYKVIGMFLNYKEAMADPLSYLTTSNGHFMSGTLMALTLLGWKAYEDYQQRKLGSEHKKVKMFPRHRVGDIAVIAAIGGFAGAKIFNAFETWDQFIKDPLASLLSSSGLTFYGGLIVATVALWYYSRKIKMDFRHLCDAAAPALILAYGIGRLGCQISGDGDWGIYNSSYITNEQGKVVQNTKSFSEQIALHHEHVYRQFDPKDNIPHKSFQAPDWLPVWMVAYNYPNNVNNIGEPLAACKGEYCSVLPLPVFPTPIYEFFMSLIIFGILWRLRKRWQTPLSMFSVYLIFNGIERFLIEQIRVNYKYDWGFMQPTQAEIIAVAIMTVGILLYIFRKQIDRLIQVDKSNNSLETSES